MSSAAAIKLRDTNLVPQKTFVPITENAAAKEFSAVILEFSSGELARAAQRTKEAAKSWKKGRSLPSVWSLMNMAQEIPAVKAWMCAKLGVQAAPEFLDDRVMTAMMAALHQVAQQNGPDGEAVRALLGAKGPK